MTRQDANSISAPVAGSMTEGTGRPGGPSVPPPGTPRRIPPYPLILGGAGLLPQFAAVLAAVFGGADWRYAALAIGYGYAALIFSFLGGLWWGIAAAAQARGDTAPGWLWVAAVAPSLIALLTYLPWVFGDPWPGPSLIVLGIAIAASAMIDRTLVARHPGWCPPWWMPLRYNLSFGLGSATLALGAVAHS